MCEKGDRKSEESFLVEFSPFVRFLIRYLFSVATRESPKNQMKTMSLAMRG
jgi:hypothetical protein